MTVRADFNFNEKESGIKKCSGYVICKDVQLLEGGDYSFQVEKIVINKYIGSTPDFDKIEKLAKENCTVLY